MSLNASETRRYARHLVLRDFGGQGQVALKNAHVAIAGLGGLGSPVALYLAAAGVGRLDLYDPDTVALSNLQRQVLYGESDIDAPKAERAQTKTQHINSEIDTRAYPQNFENGFTGANLVIDGTDDFATREAVQLAAFNHETPLLIGALAQWEGQIGFFNPTSGGACWRCLYVDAPVDGAIPTCSEAGIIGPVAGVIGTMLAVEAIKQLSRHEGAMRGGETVLMDTIYWEARQFLVAKRPNCPICA